MRPNLSKSKSPSKRPAEAVVKDIRRATRRHFSAEDKIRIALDGLRSHWQKMGKNLLSQKCTKKRTNRAFYFINMIIKQIVKR